MWRLDPRGSDCCPSFAEFTNGRPFAAFPLDPRVQFQHILQSDLIARLKSNIRLSRSQTGCERAFPPTLATPKTDARMRKGVTAVIPLKGGLGPSHNLISQCLAQTYFFYCMAFFVERKELSFAAWDGFDAGGAA